jgi:hypothetical protein
VNYIERERERERERKMLWWMQGVSAQVAFLRPREEIIKCAGVIK